MDKLPFVVRRNLRLLEEARDRILLAMSLPSPRERRLARADAVRLANEARLALARELGCEPGDIPWAAARARGEELLAWIETERQRRERGELSLDAWRESLAILSAAEAVG